MHMIWEMLAGLDWPFWLSVLAVMLLLVASAFFSGSETAMTVASAARLHQLEQDGDKRAERVNTLRARKDRLIGALLLGNNLVNISASALATSIMIKLFGEAGVAYATLVMTVLVLIFSEVLPKTYALLHTDRLALRVVGPLSLIVRLLSPFTMAVTWLVDRCLRMVGVEAGQVRLGIDPDELRGAIDLHRGLDEEIRQERVMLRSILDLAEVVVSEIMTHRRKITMIDIDTPPDEIVEQVMTSPFTRIPLYRDNTDNIVGVLHARQVMRALRARAGTSNTNGVQDVGGQGLNIISIATPPWFIPDSTTLLDQLHAFRRRREHFAIVVDEYGAVMGIVTLEDILEEIVGDIEDEHDERIAGVRPQANGSFVVDGTVTIRDLNREYEWKLPDDAASTIAGLVLHEARRIPEVGQSFVFHGFRFDILRRQRHQITSLRITPSDDDRTDP